MSTNFYLLTPCGERHLGQRAGGWQFAFRAWPALGITDTPTWLRQLTGHTIMDEYERYMDVDDFLEQVEACSDGQPRGFYGGDWLDRDGNYFSEREFS